MAPLLPEVVDGPAVAHHQSLVAPLVAQNLLQQSVVAAAGLAVPSLVGTHHLGHVSLLHECLEGRQIGLPEVAGGQVLHVELMAVPLRSAMYGEVLGTGQRLHVLAAAYAALREVVGGVALLQSAHHGQPHAGSEERILAVGLLSASPARVAEDVDVGRPERKPLIALHLSGASGHHVLGASLVAGDAERAAHQCLVPRCRHAHGDGKHRGRAVARHAVQRLVPPLEGRYAQPLDGRRHVHHDFRLLLEREPLAEVAGTFFA